MDLLRAQAEAIGDRRNAPHTRLKIQIAVASLLQTSGYKTLSVDAICRESGLSRPGFYKHFRNKEEAVLALLQRFAGTEQQLVMSLVDCDDLAQALVKICNGFLGFHLGSGALLSTMVEMRKTVPEAYKIWRNRADYLLESIFSQLERFEPFRGLDREWAEFAFAATFRALYVTVDELSSHPSPVTRRYSGDIDQLAQMFARQLHGALLAEPLSSE